MTEVLLHCADVRHEEDVVLVRQQARHLASLLGFETQDQTRIATAVSEIVRNAFDYGGGGRVSFAIVDHADYVVRVADQGPGIGDLNAVLEGRYESRTGMGVGILGARRLMDGIDITTGSGGTTVSIRKGLPPVARDLTASQLDGITRQVRSAAPRDPLGELQARNHELLQALEELRVRQQDVERLNGELAETNRGVLALYAELDDRAMQLGRASELKSNFLSSISHELRTPLNAIQNLTRLLLDRMDGELTAAQEHQVTLIRSAATTLSDMVNDLLDLARIEAGKTVLRLAKFPVADMLAALRGMLRPLVAADSIALTIDYPESDWTMCSDEGKVSQVLRNLVSNAVKFTQRGEIRLTTELDPDDQMIFTVRDTGIGIAPDDLDRIFEEYTQIEHALQHRTVGSGLGLPLSRKLATLLGGSLTASSVPGEGSVFTLRIPRLFSAAAPEESSSEAPGSVVTHV